MPQMGSSLSQEHGLIDVGKDSSLTGLYRSIVCFLLLQKPKVLDH